MERYVVMPVEDLLHEPEFYGDEPIYGITHWEVWRDVEGTPTGYTGEWIDNFTTEEEAEAFADKMNTEEVKGQDSTA